MGVKSEGVFFTSQGETSEKFKVGCVLRPDLTTKTMTSARKARDRVAGMDLNYSARSEDSFYKQVFASLKNEIEVIAEFVTKQKGVEDEDKTIQHAASLNGTMDKDVEEVIKSAQTIIEKFEHLDEVNASSRSGQGCEEDFPTDQTFRNMSSSYITQVEEVLKVAHSVAGLTRQRVDPEDWSDALSDTDSMSDMRKRLQALRMVDSLAEAQIQRVDAAGEPTNLL